MTIESDIRARLAADGTVAGLVSTRIYPAILPQDPMLPAIVFSKVSAVRVHKLTGASGWSMPRMTVHSWGRTYAEAKTVAAAVRESLNGFIGQLSDGQSPESFRRAVIRIDNELDDYEEDTDFHRVIQDYMVSHAE